MVTESGIHTPDDVALMRQHGVHAFLVGEAFMRAPDPGAKLAELFGVPPESNHPGASRHLSLAREGKPCIREN